ncbi:MAG: hypothetical protein LBI78_05875 [Campylobacteraceae bacterium]|jgi:hypothetical protein|nr:hypothetical protein [Campylobacteraceae bacterium]
MGGKVQEKKDITIAIRGKNRICLLGFPSDMMLFFDCIKFYVEDEYKDEDWSVITDRFYKKYLREEDIEIAYEKMKKIEEVFKQLSVDAIDWSFSENPNRKTTLSPNNLNSLYEVFEEYFNSFETIVGHILYGKTEIDYKYYNPMMVIIGTFPYNYYYEQMPLSEFDSLSKEGKPEWFVANVDRKE